MSQITQPQTLTTQNATIAAGTTIAGNLSFGTYIVGGANQTNLVGGADQNSIVGGADQNSIVGGADQTNLVGGADQTSYPSYGALLAPASLGPVSLLNQGVVTATGTKPTALQAGILLAASGTLANTGTITGFTGVYLSSGSLTNSGAIISTATTSGTVKNAAILGGNPTSHLDINNSGLIAAAYFGIALAGPASITNSGIIRASFAVGDGLVLTEGGNVTNHGLITGGYLGISLGPNSADAISNTGTIAAATPARQFHPHIGTGIGLYSTIANTLTNSATGLITGAVTAIRTKGAATTIINAGTITGATDAIAFTPGYANRLIIEPGAQFNGLVDGANDTSLEFTGTTSGTITDFNDEFKNFTTILIDPGASWTFSNITLAPNQTITSTGRISTLVAGNIETIIATPLACFAAGTRILTPIGQIPVESLAIGDPIITADGTDAPVKWLGRRTITNPPAAALPIRIEANAFAPGIPARDLYLSPDHAIYFENHLVPAKSLLNHRNIAPAPRRQITYVHIELATHNIIFAENLALETYLETGNRSCFENAPITALHPDFTSEKFQAIRDAKSCHPIIESGPLVERLRTILLDRAFNIQNRPNPVIARPQSSRGNPSFPQ